MSLFIRKADKTDAPLIARFQKEMAWETEAMTLDADHCLLGVLGVFEKPHRGTYYMAELDGKIAGSLLIQTEWSDWRNGEVWWIHSVYVVPEFRRQKVFSSMYNSLKESALKDPLFRGMRLFVEKENQRAQNVYRSLGMNNNHYELFEWMVTK